MFKYEEMKRKCKARIEGEMTIFNAGELAKELFAVLDDERALEMNLSKVSEIDTAGVQILMATKNKREKAGLKTSLVDHSEAVLDVFELMRLGGYFKDPVVLTKSKGA